jgi:hypothetical protein
VRFDVGLRRVLSMFLGVNRMSDRHESVMRGGMVVASLVMPGSLRVMVSRAGVMFGCFPVVFCTHMPDSFIRRL